MALSDRQVADRIEYLLSTTRTVINAERYVRNGASAASNTAGLNAALAALPNGGLLMLPGFQFNHNPVSYPGLGPLVVRGTNRLGTIATAQFSADGQVAWAVQRTGDNGIAPFMAFQDLTLNTYDTTYDKTGLQLTDCQESGLHRIQVTGYGGTLLDSVGIVSRGRQNLWTREVNVVAAVPWRIRPNPNTSNGFLTADHHDLTDLYLTIPPTYTADSLPAACLLIDDGCHISQLNLHKHAWVGGKFGLHWVQTLALGDYMTGLSIESVRSEQGIDADAWSVLVSVTSGKPLFNLEINNSELDAGRNGLKTRNVYNVTWGNSPIRHPSPRVIADIGGCFEFNWFANRPVAAANPAGIVVDSNMFLAEASPNPAGISLPATARWSRRAEAGTYNERPRRDINGLHRWSWEGTLTDGGQVQLPVNATNHWEHAEVTVRATIPGSVVYERGLWRLAPFAFSGATNGVKLESGTANCSQIDEASRLCVFCTSGSLTNSYVKNRLGGTAKVTVEVVGALSQED